MAVQSTNPDPVPPAPAAARPRAGLAVALIVLLLAAACQRTSQVDPEASRLWAEMEQSEELILELENLLADLAFSVRNLELPDARTRGLFSPSGVSLVDLGDPVLVAAAEVAGRAASWSAQPAPVAQGPSGELSLWRPLLDRVWFFESASFRVVRGRFVADGLFRTEVVFHGTARMRSGEYRTVDADQTLDWRNDGTLERADWRIIAWTTERVGGLSTHAPLFREVLDSALPDPGELERARSSRHEQLLVEYLLAKAAGDNPKWHSDFLSPWAMDMHPGLSVVDFDRDGYDDIYLMARWGPNQMFRNRGDGSFEEVAERLGLAIVDRSTSAVFADFDNDGDADLFLGRSLRPSMYLVNQGGRFVRSPERVDGPLPYFASSVAAVDYDGDGLLDVYISTYGSQYFKIFSASDPEKRDFLERFLGPDDAQHLMEIGLAGGDHGFLDFAGPPNVLLHNRGGGRFEIVKDAGPIRAFRHTFQASFADFDGDGDPDVYLANDFAPDTLLRNDGGRFSDATEELLTGELGYGMGVSWGDYDRDGRQDLYVTNMYSKAGSRITERLDFIDPRFAQSAEGNRLFHNTAAGFEKVSGTGPEDLHVGQAGWGWGSQFVDVDNDGFLDLYALAGFYTAPAAVELAGDT